MIKEVSELTNNQLNWAVAKAEGYDHDYMLYIKKGKAEVFYFEEWNPTEDWAIAGPIIDKHIGNVWKHNKLYEAEPDVWSAAIYVKYPTGHQAAGAIYSMDGPTALIAICRTYVFAQLGEEISIPEELL